MAAISTFFLRLLLISFVPALVMTSTVFDVELVHRDSPKSPLYNSSMTTFDRLQTAALRSVNRASYLAKRIAMKTSTVIDVRVHYEDWEFLMEFSMGTPNPQHVWGILDIGSDLNWVNCHCDDDQMCVYHYSYADGSNIDGMFSSDTFRFYSSDTKQFTSIPNMLFGCNFRSFDTGDNDFGSTIGLFLGRGHTTVTGKVTVTSLMTQDTDYAVQLNAISIPGAFNIDYHTRRSKLTADNIIFDSGTSMTTLDTQVVDELVMKLTDYVNLPTVKPEGEFKLCFDVNSTEQEEELPGMLFSFAGELGNFSVSPENLFTWFGAQVKCMMILGTNDIQIFGNIMQKDVLVGYDLEKMELTLTEKECI
ncbi:probable aspartic protease At2g35615 [Zingiber officinale]|uniref:probable aspartic protease At2g35615 n=1 Tax=Zingiber officinale TaxID=94328 RepID=UPI001C4CBAD5|nr:probable aspartic protease At2g35615 [Zingiber officinale]